MSIGVRNKMPGIHRPSLIRKSIMQTLSKFVCMTIAASLVACEKHLENNQDTPQTHRVPPNSEKGTPAPENPPIVPPATGSQQAAGTGTR